jgi:hypothetical protein
VYSVCQKEDAAGADFSWTDSISELTSTPNYCGVPNFEAVFDGEYTDEWKASLSFDINSTDNTGFVSYGAGMCTRDLAVSTPYTFKIQLSYTVGWDPTTSTESVSIKLNDPCVNTVWPTQ